MTLIGRVFPPVVGLEIHCRNSYPIDGVTSIRLGPIFPAQYFVMEGRSRTSPEQELMLTQGRSSGECQRLKSDIHLGLSVWHSTSNTNLSSRELIQ